MNVLNRVFVVLLLLAATVACSIALVIPIQVLNTVSQQAQITADTLIRISPYVRLGLGVVAAAVLDIILFFLLVLELRRPPGKSIRVEKAEGGEVLVEIRSIADQLRYEVDQLPAVLRVRPRISGKRRGVLVALDVEVAAENTVPKMAAEIIETARRVVEENMGLKLTRSPKVNLRVVTRPKGKKKPSIFAPEPEEPASEEPFTLPETVDEPAVEVVGDKGAVAGVDGTE